MRPGTPRGHPSARRIIVASNRGPLSFSLDQEGRPVAKRGVGGLVTALSGALEMSGGLWIASAMTEEDRRQASGARLPGAGEGDGPGYGVRYLVFDRKTYDGFYNGVANRILWFLHHYLWDVPREPRFDAAVDRCWAAYRQVNEAFAVALSDEGGRMGSRGPAYLIQDYHLALAPSMLRRRRPGAGIAHFSHVPFAGPGYFRILPTRMREELLAGYLGADVVGFHAAGWADNFLMCCRLLPGARVDVRARRVRWDGRDVRVRVNPISIDVEAIQAQAKSSGVAQAQARLGRWLGGRKLILRVDRTDLSKNILRGLQAYRDFLRTQREWHGRLAFLALLNPSREAIPEYQEYLRLCLREVKAIRKEFATPDWDPIRVLVKDDYEQSLAAFGLYDVLMVNPVFDGMNLVAKEGPLLNRRDGVLILSENAGAFSELGDHALRVNPFDVGETTRALASALEMAPGERARRARGLREKVVANRLDRWVARQIDDLESPR